MSAGSWLIVGVQSLEICGKAAASPLELQGGEDTKHDPVSFLNSGVSGF